MHFFPCEWVFLACPTDLSRFGPTCYNKISFNLTIVPSRSASPCTYLISTLRRKFPTSFSIQSGGIGSWYVSTSSATVFSGRTTRSCPPFFRLLVARDLWLVKLRFSLFIAHGSYRYTPRLRRDEIHVLVILRRAVLNVWPSRRLPLESTKTIKIK